MLPGNEEGRGKKGEKDEKVTSFSYLILKFSVCVISSEKENLVTENINIKRFMCLIYLVHDFNGYVTCEISCLIRNVFNKETYLSFLEINNSESIIKS